MARFDITYDYLCPFARIANEAVLEALDDGAPWQVTFRPFSLSQNHLEDGAVPTWERDLDDPSCRGVRALLWSLAVRDSFSEAFHLFHHAVYTAKHDTLSEIGDESVLRELAASVGLDGDAVAARVASGEPARTLAAEHNDLVASHAVFGVPTFIGNGEAVFVRLMERHNRADIERVLDMVGWANLNEFKRTRLPM
ncbi:MAG: DsbA family protein [Acidimicrobiia bacterium]